MLLCKVCRHGEVSHGKDFCEACRSFFKRNRNRSNLTCKSGHFNCFDGPLDNKFGNTTRTGTHWRMLCPACRMKKCRKIRGLESDDEIQENKVPKTPSSVALVKMSNSMNQIAPPEDDTPLEWWVDTVVKACNELKQGFNTSHFRTFPFVFRSSEDVAYTYLDSIGQQLTIMKQFASCFPFYKKLAVGDRTSLFLSAQFKLACIEGMLYKHDFFFAGFSSFAISSAIPVSGGVLLDMYEQAQKTWQYFQTMNFNNIEAAFIVAIIFFGSGASSLSPTGQEMVKEGINQLQFCLSSYLSCIYPDEQKQSTRQQMIYHIAQNIGNESLWRTNTFRHSIMPSNPDLNRASYFYAMSSPTAK